MSKPVRLPDYLHAEIERLAAAEKRSLANMVQVLLEQALKFESSGAAVGKIAASGSAENHSEEQGGTDPPSRVRPERAAPENPDVKTDFK